MEFMENLIQKTRAKFILFSIIGMIVAVVISAVGWRAYQETLHGQEAIQSFYRTIRQQLSYVYEIALVGQELADVQASEKSKILKANFDTLLEEFESENKEFVSLLSSDELRDLHEANYFATREKFQDQISRYINQARLLSQKSQVRGENVQAHVQHLNVNALRGLSDLFKQIGAYAELKYRDSLDNLNTLGIFLIVLCFLGVILIWTLVFRPLYSTLLVQHETLIEAILEARSASRSKTDFLANISHEIRTPMTAIMGYAEVLENEKLNFSDKMEAARVIRRNAKHLLEIINEILDVSKVEAGKILIEKEKTNLAQLLSDIYFLVNVHAQEKNIELNIKNHGPVPQVIWTDGKRLKQILYNLVGNAIKFTDGGYVSLTASFENRNGKNLLICRVKDTGCGIPQSGRAKLFQAFQQVDSSVNRKYGGTGLGLVLARGLAQKLDGDLVLEESVVGVGSTFRLEIDAGKESDQTLSAHLANSLTGWKENRKFEEKYYSLRGSKILVVDDAKENAILFQLYLSSAGAKVDVTTNGEVAIQMVQEKPYDLVLLDLQMPGKDGYQVLTEMRNKLFKSPIVALTAHAMREEEAKTRKFGFDGHISKPIESGKLIRKVASFVQERSVYMTEKV